MLTSTSTFLSIRGLRYHVRQWGRVGAPQVFMLHGWMDMSATFQFVVEALRQDWHVLAPDWRGFGQTDCAPAYWFPDYLADLDALLAHYQPDTPVRLVGHSMGGNVAMFYAGIRPERVARVATLEGIGLPSISPQRAPARYARWLTQQREPLPKMGQYASLAMAAARLQQQNPRLTAAQANFLATEWAQSIQVAQTPMWSWQADPKHKWVNPILFRLDEMLACWQQISAPVLWVTGENSDFLADVKRSGDYDLRWQALSNVTQVMLENAGHLLQRDQPAQLAKHIESFFEPTR
ncbi:alpha/beta fold hydrolase [Parvibium lacunae]|uniref:Alpha/beta hydrolase n=1 Tax=Parvibium lacunae TaxID=1888893 RepID=A0A368L8E8_9BURK|nr:alpha/beta hydrolase [Parvibium lacunae]RCS59791.1 alpha/beta hydrolase [Parvibium lacunae]